MNSQPACLFPSGLFADDPQQIADSLASRGVSSNGPADGLRLLGFYLSHAGRRLSASRLRSLEKAKRLLSARVEAELKSKTRHA